VEKVTGLSQVQVDYNRDRLAQYGLTMEDVNRVLRAAFAGSQAGVVYDEERRFGLVVRLDKDYRQSLDDVKNLSVALPGGGQIPFEQVADISIKSGPAQVSREDTKRRITVGFNVRGRDVQSVIKDVSGEIDSKVKFPPAYYVAYGGQFKNFEAAKDRLLIAVPVALLLIFVLLYFTFHSVIQSLLIFTAVPMSAIGGVFALWMRGMNFSISAGVGFIALFGVAVLNGIVLIAEFNRLEKEGETDIYERIRKGLHTRLRPVIMTAAVASLGFLPMALSTSAGAEVQKPLATVVIGGLITATILTLIILPIFYIYFSGKRKETGNSSSGKSIAVIILIFALFGVNQAKAQAQEKKTINLHNAIQMALDSNLSVRSSGYSLEVQKALKGAAWDFGKTSIDGQFGQFNSYTKDNSFTLSQSFEFPSVYANQHKLAKANVKSSEWQLKNAQLETATQVKQVYWQLAYLYSKQKLLNYQDSLYSGFMKAAELRAKVGETNKLEMITARSQSMEIKNQLQQIQADKAILTRQLQTLLNTKNQLLPADTLLKQISFQVTSSESNLAENPSLGYANQKVAVSHIEKQLEVSRALPDFSVGYFSQTMKGKQEVNGISRSFGPGDRFNGVQAGIAIPLWVSPFAAKIKAAKLKQQVASTDAEQVAKALESNYQSLLDQYQKYLKSIAYYEKQAIPEANLIISQATQSYKAGALGYLDYVLSLGRALTIRQNYLDELNNCNQTVINLEFLSGKTF
jgi:cobalt-zinc-cadmium resistance protein CzcA